MAEAPVEQGFPLATTRRIAGLQLGEILGLDFQAQFGAHGLERLTLLYPLQQLLQAMRLLDHGRRVVHGSHSCDR
jgi:hypothetical protein